MSLLDVVAVNMDTKRVRLMAEGKTERNAEAIVEMAVIRRGCEEEFFTTVPAGSHKEGDPWRSSPSQ